LFLGIVGIISLPRASLTTLRIIALRAIAQVCRPKIRGSYLEQAKLFYYFIILLLYNYLWNYFKLKGPSTH
jgi:hypothetical protein